MILRGGNSVCVRAVKTHCISNMQANSCLFKMMASRHPQTIAPNKAHALITINNNICMTLYTPRPWRMGFVVFGIRKLRHRKMIWTALQLYLSERAAPLQTRPPEELQSALQADINWFWLCLEQIGTAQLCLACLLTQPGMFSRERAQAEHGAQEH